MIDKIPVRELWLTQNHAARASFDRGLAEATQGQGKEMDFSAHLEDEDQETDEKSHLAP